MQGRYTQIPQRKIGLTSQKPYSQLREQSNLPLMKKTSSKYQRSDTPSQKNKNNKIPDVVLNLIAQQTRQKSSIKKSSGRFSRKSQQNRQSESIYPESIFDEEPVNVPSNHIRKSMAIKMNLSQMRRSKSIQEKCQICLMQVPKKQFIIFSQQCKHKFCRSCLHQYVIYKIQMFQNVECPHEDCRILMSENSSIYKQLPLDSRQKLKKICQYQNIMKKQNFRLCPIQSCDGQIYVGDGTFNPKCQKCNLTFCKKCSFRVHDGDCQPFQLDFFQNTLQYRQCSKCKNIIQKSQGCNHMTCRCGYQFCYLCGVKWRNSHVCQNLNGQQFVGQTCQCCCCQCQECDFCQNIDMCCQCQCFDWQCCQITPIRWFFKIFLIIFVIAIGIPIYIAYILLTVCMHLFMGIMLGCCVMPCQFIQQTESTCKIALSIIFFPITLLISMTLGVKSVFQEQLVQQLQDFITFPCQIVGQICEV